MDCSENIDTNETLISDDQFEVTKDLLLALNEKEEGNKSFRNGNYDSSIEFYSRAISLCPLDDIDNLAVFLGNRAAAYFAINEYDLVIQDCNLSLEMKSDYVKVLFRRCQAYEKLDKIEEALKDAKKIRDINDDYPRINDIIRQLEKKNEIKITKLKEETFGQLKELGNNILGNFGMSMDNFKFTQDSNTGSWSVQMQK